MLFFFFLPSVVGFLISSTLISFFLTLRVELTSLCNLLNFTDSSVSSSDCSLDWQRNRGEVHQIVAPEPSVLAAGGGAPVGPPGPPAVENQAQGAATHAGGPDPPGGWSISGSRGLPRPPLGERGQGALHQAGPVIPAPLPFQPHCRAVWAWLSSVWPIVTA